MQRQHVALVEKNDQAKKDIQRIVKEQAQVSMRQRKTLTRYKADHKSIHALASVMLPIETIAEITGASEETLYKRYGKIIQKARGETKRKLASAMHTKAIEQGDTKMQIWLSKQHLGYKETFPENMQPVAIQINIQDIPA